MKNKSIIGLLAAFLGLGTAATSCEDMLTPDMDLYAENFSGKDTVDFYFGILGNVQDVIENNILLGELRGDLADTTMYVSDTIASLSNFERLPDGDNGLLNRAAYYKVINQCNFYLAAVDTMATKNNSYYMRREFAQVQLVRAWTYMQLVQNYGSVPFITKPVDNANTGWETAPEEGFATADNLLDKLLSHDLERAYAYEKSLGRPNYGTFNNGAINVAHSLSVFPADLVMGDLYLLRGASRSDYEKAAAHYYTYMDNEIRYNSRGVSLSSAADLMEITMSNGNKYYRADASSWTTGLRGTPGTTGEVGTLVLSAANSTFGTVLTRVAQIYGFDPSSSNSTNSGVDSNGETTTTTSGRISLKANYKNRQVAASRRYLNLSAAQSYRHYEYNSNNEPYEVEYYPGGDARSAGTIADVETTEGKMSFIQKRNISVTSNGMSVSEGSFSYTYFFPVYRLRQVYLRYAEAINRAGYPRHAFAVLRDGLTRETVPTVLTDSVVDGKIFPYIEDAPDQCDIDVDEMRRAAGASALGVNYLDFSDTRWDNTTGIHALGCGGGRDRGSYDLDTLYSYRVAVGTRMLEEASRSAGSEAQAARLSALRLLDGDTDPAPAPGGEDEGSDTPAPADDPVIPADIAYQINAVETLIADEMALETAFEGFRFYDLMRMARHKNSDTWGLGSADYGTDWLAWTVSRRSLDLKPYESPLSVGPLYGVLRNMENWFLPNPEY